MKFTNPKISIPYIGMEDDGTPTRNFAHLSFDGVVDHRWLKRQVRRWVKFRLFRHISTSELRDVCRTKRISA